MVMLPETAVPGTLYQMSMLARSISNPFVPSDCTTTRLMPGCRATLLFVHRASHADQTEVEPLTRIVRVLMASDAPPSEIVGALLCR